MRPKRITDADVAKIWHNINIRRSDLTNGVSKKNKPAIRCALFDIEHLLDQIDADDAAKVLGMQVGQSYAKWARMNGTR